MKIQKQYQGSVYLGVVGPETENGVARDSIHNIVRRSGDSLPRFIRATKGYEARQLHINTWIHETQHDFALFMDHDQLFPSDTLERLRNHKLPLVSGYYLRRRYSPIAPVWFKPFTGRWPFEPFTDDPERGRLHKLGASGWGCLLVHRDVITALQPILKNEAEVLEDDMDIWPYDLGRMLAAISGLQELVKTRPAPKVLQPALEKYTAVLSEEFRPLRADNTVVGSDIRFPFYAKKAGFQLWGDPDVACGHVLNYPLHPDDFSAAGSQVHAGLKDNVQKGVRAERRFLAKKRKELAAVEL